METATFDIETTALEGIGSGLILCVCIRPWRSHTTRNFRLDYLDGWDSGIHGFLEVEETKLLTDVRDELLKYDLLVGQNIEAFDLAYIRTRCFKRGLAFDYNPFTYDVMKAFGRTRFRTPNNRFGKPSKSLGMIADLLGIEQEKTALYPDSHWLSIWGNAAEREEAMQDTLRHCQADVRMTEKAYRLLLPFDGKAILRRWM